MSGSPLLTLQFTNRFAGKGCDLNGAWSFNASNKTITSVMDGKCLEATSCGGKPEVSACNGKATQQWKWDAGVGGGGGHIQPLRYIRIPPATCDFLK